MKEKERKWKIRDLPRIAKKVLVAIFRGELLLRLDMGRFFAHILFLFFVLIMVIWGSMGIEARMSKVEKNRASIEELRIVRSRLQYEIMSISNRSSLSRMLKEYNSEVTQRETPAIDITDEVKNK